jgi:NAD(P)-dependent dehydrogenase (short-subunit alcohol dehydrogenase family)
LALAGLEDKVILITGGGSGIGQATARRLAAEGARLAIVDRDELAIASTLELLDSDRALGLGGDVSDAGDVQRCFTAAAERFGRLDGLHNNAAITIPAKDLADVEPDEFDRLLAINFRGCFLVLRAMLRRLREQGDGGAIVNMSSALGVRGAAGRGVYGASKAAVASLTRTAAIEEGPRGTRVNAVLPGPTDTPMLGPRRELLERSGFIARLPLGRIGQPDEIAALVAWLLSDESRFVAGGLYAVDGGENA